MSEIPLAGGFVSGAVRIGDTVRRTASPRSAYVHELLDLFAAAGWSGAPRFVGYDDAGREVVEYVDGDVPAEPTDPSFGSDASLVRVAELVREFHDLTVDSALLAGGESVETGNDWLGGPSEVVCHNDLSPKNTVYRRLGGWHVPVTFVDWDIAAPGRRIHDIAHMCWQYVGLGPAVTDAADAARRVRLMADAYGLADRSELVDTVAWWQNRCWRGIEAEAEAGAPHAVALRAAGAIREVRDAFDWVVANRSRLAAALR
jgi:hypothetical protein